MTEVKSRRFEGKVAIITGAAHGIGKAYAERLAAEGANVVIADLDKEAADAVAQSLGETGPAAIGVRCDISDEEAVKGLVRTTVETFGRLDILINNASMFSVVPMSRGGFEDIAATNGPR